jgi:hypothetical protein
VGVVRSRVGHRVKAVRGHGGPVTGAAVAFRLLPLPGRLPVGWLGHGGLIEELKKVFYFFQIFSKFQTNLNSNQI